MNMTEGDFKLVMDLLQVQAITFQCLCLLVQLGGNGEILFLGYHFHLSNLPHRILPPLPVVLRRSIWLV
jgi:hypothetical protein